MTRTNRWQVGGWRMSGVGITLLAFSNGCGAAPGSGVESPAPAPKDPVASAEAPAPNASPPANTAPAAAVAPTDGEGRAGDLLASDTAQEQQGLATQSQDGAAQSAKVADECRALCENARDTCSHKTARECRANCGKYQALADRCETQILGAIRCQASAPKLVCSMVTSECVEQFRKLDACEQGKSLDSQSSGTKVLPPPGWQRIEDTDAGFAVHLPEGAKVEDVKGVKTWVAAGANGVTYRVAVLPALAGAASEKRLMQGIIGYLGHECQPAVRLHGRFETEREVGERFDGRCADGMRWHGIARASKDHLVLVLEQLPPNAQGSGEAYYFSFEYLR